MNVIARLEFELAYYDSAVRSFNWPCRIHRLLLCKGVKLFKRWRGSSNAGALGNAENPFIAIASGSTQARSGSTWQDPISGSNRTKLHAYAKLNCLKWNCFWQSNCVLMLNWIVWKLFEIELIICIKMDLALNNLQRLICHKTYPPFKPSRFILCLDVKESR